MNRGIRLSAIAYQQSFLLGAFEAQAAWLQATSVAMKLNPLLWPARGMIDTAHHYAQQGIVTNKRPSFNIQGTEEHREPISDFSDLLYFDRKSDRNDPHVLVVPPMSGHHPTILRGTVEGLLPYHDISLIDWRMASKISASAGPFNLERNVTDIISAFENFGPQGHVIAVSQSTIPTLIALAIMSAQKHPDMPQSVAFIGGPFSPSAAPTDMMSLVKELTPDWFERNVIRTASNGRKIYPADTQYLAMHSASMPARAIEMGTNFWRAAMGFGAPKSTDPDFDREHRAIADIPGELFIDMLRHFHTEDLLKGKLTYRGQRVDLSALSNIRVLTVEGGDDTISAPQQTAAIHHYLRGIPRAQHFNLLAEGANHYDIFHGPHWKNAIAPQVAAFIRHQAPIRYADIPSSHSVMPRPYFNHVQDFVPYPQTANKPAKRTASGTPQARITA